MSNYFCGDVQVRGEYPHFARRFFQENGIEIHQEKMCIRDRVQTVMKIPKTIFNPRPAVDSAVVQFTRKLPQRAARDEAQFFALVKGLSLIHI